MNEIYERLFRENEKLCVILPSLGLDIDIFMKKVNRTGSKYEICLINYSGFGKSSGTFPGNNIIANVDKIISMIEKDTGKRVRRIVGDSYGGLIAIGLLSKFGSRYADTEVVLTSPLISFDRLEKNAKSPQSKEGFVRYLADHQLVKEVDRKQLNKLVNHKEIIDPFLDNISGKKITIYHYNMDGNLRYEVSKDFAKISGAKLVKLYGNRHALLNFEDEIVRGILNK